jgi:hypothetical protein
MVHCKKAEGRRQHVLQSRQRRRQGRREDKEVIPLVTLVTLVFLTLPHTLTPHTPKP